MFSRDPRIDPHTANVVGHDTYQPYARRTITTVFVFGLALLLVGGFSAWYFFGTPDDEYVEVAEIETVDGQQIVVEREPELPADAG